MYKSHDKEEYKTTSIRIRKNYYNILKDKARKDYRSTNYLINKILIDYILNEDIYLDLEDIFE
ncbi:MAG: hypothetical protein ACLUL3_14220 [Romboutsia timonensis]|uniref:hypothetical protein n=1 Tax=Romboutsia timonensis TaxID=1776391 RepID=UPI0039945E95